MRGGFLVRPCFFRGLFPPLSWFPPPTGDKEGNYQFSPAEIPVKDHMGKSMRIDHIQSRLSCLCLPA